MERSPHDLKGKSVYILELQPQRSASHEILPFATEDDLLRHVCDLISLRLGQIEDSYREAIIPCLEQKDYKAAIYQYRQAQLNGKKVPSLDFTWDERPSVIL